jgi:hypothetical protein
MINFTAIYFIQGEKRRIGSLNNLLDILDNYVSDDSCISLKSLPQGLHIGYYTENICMYEVVYKHIKEVKNAILQFWLHENNEI